MSTPRVPPVGSNTDTEHRCSLVFRDIWKLKDEARSMANVKAVEDELLTMSTEELDTFSKGVLLEKCFADPMKSLIMSHSHESRKWQKIDLDNKKNHFDKDAAEARLDQSKNLSKNYQRNMLEAEHSCRIASYLYDTIEFYEEMYPKKNLPLPNLAPDERVNTLQDLFGLKEYTDIGLVKFPTAHEHILLSRQLVNLGFTESKAYEKYMEDGHKLSFSKDKIEVCQEHTARLFGLVKPAPPEPKNNSNDGASLQRTPRKRKSVPGSPAATSQKKQKQQFAASILGSPQMQKFLNDNPDLVAQARANANFQTPPSKDQSPGG